MHYTRSWIIFVWILIQECKRSWKCSVAIPACNPIISNRIQQRHNRGSHYIRRYLWIFKGNKTVRPMWQMNSNSCSLIWENQLAEWGRLLLMAPLCTEAITVSYFTYGQRRIYLMAHSPADIREREDCFSLTADIKHTCDYVEDSIFSALLYVEDLKSSINKCSQKWRKVENIERVLKVRKTSNVSSP